MVAADTVAWPQLIERARDAILNAGARHTGATLTTLGLRRIPRSSNRIYVFRVAGREFCLKFYQSVAGQSAEANVRAEREWQALTTLAAHDVACTPRPIAHDLEAPLPAIVMERVGGQAIGKRPVTLQMHDSFARALAALYKLTPDGVPAASFPNLVDPAAWQVHFPERLATLEAQEGATQARQALVAARRWLESDDPSILRTPAPVSFSRGDANFANCIWDGRRMALVDFEYCGWRDRAYDLADLIELDGAYETIFGRGHASAAAWERFVAGFSLSITERERFRAARRFLAWVWALRFWPQGDQEEVRPFLRQLHRIRTL